MRERTVIHVELKTPFRDHTHFYFGSISAIFEDLTTDQIGISSKSLYNFKVEPGKEFRNSYCIIRKGELKSKKGNRKLPTQK